MKVYLFCIIVLFVQAGCERPDREGRISAAPRKPDPIIVSKLQEIIEVRQREAETARLLLEMGKGADDGAAEVALAEARIALAEENGQPALVVVELRKVVKSLGRRLARAEALAKDHRRSMSELAPLRVAFLEAEIRLRRERIAQGTDDHSTATAEAMPERSNSDSGH